MKFKLKHKFFSALFITGLIPILILGGLGIYLLINFAKNNIEYLEKTIFDQKKSNIQNFFDQHFENLDIIITTEASNIPYYNDLDNYFENYNLYHEKFILQKIIDQRPEILEISFLDLRGDTKIKYYRIKYGLPKDFIEIESINFDNQSKTIFFEKSKNGQLFISSDIFYTLNGPALITSNPIKSKDGKVVAILKTKLSLSPLNKIIKGSLGKLGYVYLTDKYGNLIYHSKINDISKLRIYNLENVLKNKVGVLTKYKNFDQDVYGLVNFLDNYGLYLIVEWPTIEANQIINRQIILGVLSIIAIILVTLILSLILAQKIIKPIEILKSGSRQIAQGKLEKINEIKTGDELEELIHEFNFMVDGLIQLQKLKDEFVFIAAHELKAPVAAIKGYLTLLIDGTVGKIDEIAKEFMIKIKNSNERLIQLVTDLLQIARAEAGAIKIEIHPVNIEEAILPIINEFKIEVEKRRITIDYQKFLELPKIYADLDRLKEIFANLISNAIKYNLDNGKVFIYHQIKNEHLLTFVKDTGLGIPKDQQGKIFQKFFRVQSKATEDIQGTGLGLFIVKQLVEKMNGKIWFESEEGKGTTFIISLPIAKTQNNQ